MCIRDSHHSAGYDPKTHPDDYLSSKIRKASAEMEIGDINDYEKIMPSLNQQNFEPDSNYNMRRTTDGMRSSTQTMMHLDKLQFICYLFPDECVFKEVEDKTPRDYHPKIDIRVIQYNE